MIRQKKDKGMKYEHIAYFLLYKESKRKYNNYAVKSEKEREGDDAGMYKIIICHTTFSFVSVV